MSRGQSISDIAGFFAPTSVAIVGASARDGNAYRAGGRAVLDHLVAYGFTGSIWPVHPSAKSVGGVPAFASLGDLPGVPDCVVVAVPAPAVGAVLTECAAIGASRALLLSGGFGELGPEGAELEREILATALDSGIRLVGPNSTGLINVAGRVAMSMTSVLSEGTALRAGGLALVMQSGAIGSSITERARAADVGISHMASIGNQLDVEAGEILSYLASVPEVRGVAMYLEAIKNGATMSEGVARMHGAGKSVVALLGGRTAIGEKAASSHTGKLLGRGALERGLLDSLEVTLVDDLDDLWLVGDFLAKAEPASGRTSRWAIMSFSGGMGVLTADALAGTGATLASFATGTIERLRSLLPSYVQPSNPLDIGSGAMPDAFGPLLQAIVEDPYVDGVCLPMPMGARGWQKPIVDGIVLASRSGKPLLVGWYGGEALDDHVARLRANGVMTVVSPRELGRIVQALTATPLAPLPEMAGQEAAPAGVVGGAEALRALEAAGIEVAAMRLAGDDDALAAAAADLSFPVVLKSANAGIAHRLELGLVRTGIDGEEELRRAAAEMRELYAKQFPGANEPLTFLVQDMARGDHEIVLSVRDAGALGWFGAVGFGGALIEVLDDIAYVPLPCSVETLERAVRRLRTASAWLGHRNSSPIDLTWVSATLGRIVEVAQANGWRELEANPTIVGAQGNRIVDALASFDQVETPCRS